MTIKIDMLRAFCTVAETGNLSDAASRLGRTQSAISMTLKQLEDHLGRPLFESDRKNRLSQFGQQVLQVAQSQIRSFDGAIESLEQLAAAPLGVLKVAAVPSVAALVFPKLVRVMGQRFPGAQLELRDTDTSQVCDALTRGWADIGIASVNQPMNGVTSTKLFSDAFGLVMAKSHPLAARDGDINIQDVFDAAFIRNELCEQITLPAFQDGLADVALTVSNLQSLLAMLADGDWVTVLPPSVLPLSGRPLVFKPIKGMSDVRRVYLLRRQETAFPEMVATATEVIADLWR